MPRVSEMMPRHPITPTTGLWDELDESMQNWLTSIAANVKVLLARGKSDDAWDELQWHGLEAEGHAAIWTRFDSGERRILSAVAETRKDRL